MSTKIAPIGAVMIIDTTAAVKTIAPQSKPSLNAMAPIDACTVALGKYDIIKNNLSLNVYLLLITDTNTPIVINISPIKIKLKISALVLYR